MLELSTYLKEFMMESCYFCQSIQQGSGLDFIPELETDLFVVSYDAYPVTPGHVLIIPKRHAQYMRDLTAGEQENLVKTVITAKQYLLDADLKGVYSHMAQKMKSTKAEGFISLALSKLEATSRPPEAFNDGLNDGPPAGQTVPHFHWHIMPRWADDTSDSRGGIRHMFPGMGNYHKGVSQHSAD